MEMEIMVMTDERKKRLEEVNKKLIDVLGNLTGAEILYSMALLLKGFNDLNNLDFKTFEEIYKQFDDNALSKVNPEK